MCARGEQKQREELEATSKLFEKNLLTEENQCRYDKCKQDLEEIYDNIAEGTCIRSSCKWYEESEKSSKFFLKINDFLDKLQLPKLNITEINECDNELF